MKKTLAVILACCLITGCGPVPERFEDPNISPDRSYISTSVSSDDDPAVSEDPQNSKPRASVTASRRPQSNKPTSSSSSSSKPQSSKPIPSSSSSSKPQSSKPIPSSSSSSKPQSSVSSPVSEPPAPEIIGNYGQRAPEAWEIEYADEVFRLVNEERVKAGLPELKKLDKLTESATVRAWETLVKYGHDRPDGRDFYTALDEQGIHYRACGENIAAGQRTPQQVVDAWMNSPGHRANILSDKYEYLGVGFYYDNDGTGGSYRYFWAQNFCCLF